MFAEWENQRAQKVPPAKAQCGWLLFCFLIVISAFVLLGIGSVVTSSGANSLDRGASVQSELQELEENFPGQAFHVPWGNSIEAILASSSRFQSKTPFHRTMSSRTFGKSREGLIALYLAILALFLVHRRSRLRVPQWSPAFSQIVLKNISPVRAGPCF
ncbi:MAG: hypothetical protein PHS41_07790 [Victivallaceae bacterium]|nr:hypothetical protein [Victivallaceae bacterium]